MLAPLSAIRKCQTASLALLLFVTVLFSACAGAPHSPASGSSWDTAEAARQNEHHTTDNPIDGVHGLAPLERNRRLLEIAEKALTGSDRSTAAAALDGIDPQVLDHIGRSRLALLKGKLALADGLTGKAVTTLPATVDGLPPELATDIIATRIAAYTSAGMTPQAIEQLVMLERYLPTTAKIAESRERIWETLMSASRAELATWSERAPSKILRGWYDLAHIAKTHLTRPEALAAEITRWQTRYPNHPANPSAIFGSQSVSPSSTATTDQVAILLPLSGPLASAGTAVLDGILAAYHDTPASRRSPLKIYDVGGTPEDILIHYQKAIAEGAGFVIGPLDKAAVSILAGARLPVPVLALNVADDAYSRSNLYQFGLNPEDEVIQAADRALMDGHERALVVAPVGEWGDRLLRQFEAHFVERGGRVIATARFDPTATDHSPIVSAALLVDQSNARFRSLKSLLGREVHFEPRRRQDLDMVMMIATPQQARLLQPQLRFHYAHDLPVVATSHVYTGLPDPRNDRDLDGTIFNDIPWLIDGVNPRAELRARIEQQLSAESRKQPRLVALGVDAYNLLPVLPALEGRRIKFGGVTGQLWADDRGVIHRELRWLRFRDGVPTPLAVSAAEDGPTP